RASRGVAGELWHADGGWPAGWRRDIGEHQPPLSSVHAGQYLYGVRNGADVVRSYLAFRWPVASPDQPSPAPTRQPCEKVIGIPDCSREADALQGASCNPLNASQQRQQMPPAVISSEP